MDFVGRLYQTPNRCGGACVKRLSPSEIVELMGVCYRLQRLLIVADGLCRQVV